MKKTAAGIYMIKNNISGNTYIGSTSNLSRRISRHKYVIKNCLRDNLYILEDAQKYGLNSFEFNILEHCNVDDLKDREDHYFKLYNPTYNVWPTIFSAKNRHYSSEQKENLVQSALINLDKINLNKEANSLKLKAAWIRRKNNPNFQQIMSKSSRIGSSHSEETRKSMSKNRLGKKKPEGFGDKIRQIRMRTKLINGKFKKKEQ